MRIPPQVLKIADVDKARLRVLFLAKHAFSDGRPDAEDGSHAIYHHELRQTLEAIGVQLDLANDYSALHRRPDADFVVTLLNRGGFTNSEMLAPLLLTQHGVPFLGASPILRGLADDKHLTKAVAARRGVPTTPWTIHRRGQGPVPAPRFAWDRLVIKPNASSASWGVLIADQWQQAKTHAEALLAQGHDVILEPYAPLIDVAVPVVGADGPLLLPTLGHFPPHRLGEPRSYEEKRNLVNSPSALDPLEEIDDPLLVRQLQGHVRKLLPELWPFDYGRFEFRWNPETGDLRFMEVNLSCNLWSRKTISRSAARIGIHHTALVESILAHSMERQGLIRAERASVPGYAAASAVA